MEGKRIEYLFIVLNNIRIYNITNLLEYPNIIEAMNKVAKNSGFEGNFTLEELNKYLSLI